MKKNDIIILGIYIVIGIAMVVIGVTIEVDYYSPMIFAMGFGLTFSSVLQFVRYYYNTRPENVEAYRKKVHQQQIDLKDERKVQLRNRAGYITWVITMAACFAGAFIAAVLRADSWVIGVLAGIAITEYIVATIIYKYLCAKL